MIFLVYESKLCVATIIFYTCIYYPYLQAKHSLLTVIGFFLDLYQRPLECPTVDHGLSRKDFGSSCPVDLLMERYGDLKSRSCCEQHCNHVMSECNNGCGVDPDEMCSVCLVEFEDEDLVSKLSKCGHVYHMSCIESWVERNQFTCPLCRSIFLGDAGGISSF